jgi:hypothetical protein
LATIVQVQLIVSYDCLQLSVNRFGTSGNFRGYAERQADVASEIAALKEQLASVVATLVALANAAAVGERGSYSIKEFLAGISCPRANTTNYDAKDAARA